jgi:hypothetical protein
MTAMWELGRKTGDQEQILGLRSWFLTEYQKAFSELPHASDAGASEPRLKTFPHISITFFWQRIAAAFGS